MSYPPPPEGEQGPDQPDAGGPGHGPGRPGQPGYGQPGHGPGGYGQHPPPYGHDPNQPAYGYGQGQHVHGHPPAQHPYGFAQPPYQYGGGYYASAIRPEHPEAVPSLVIGVIALGAGLMPFLLGLPLLLGPWAWIKGRRTLGEIDVSGGHLGGRGQAKGGYICGVIATALLILWVMGLSVLAALTLLA
jgi:hypothetical protein